MNWLPAIAAIAVNLVINVITAGVIYGKLTEKVAQLERREEDAQKDRRSLWKEVSLQGKRIEKIRGRLRMNGDSEEVTG